MFREFSKSGANGIAANLPVEPPNFGTSTTFLFLGFRELPQILNIWKGAVSWVGARAYPINVVHIKEESGNLPDGETARGLGQSRLRVSFKALLNGRP